MYKARIDSRHVFETLERVRDHLVTPHVGLPDEIALPILVFPLDAASGEKVSRELEVSGLLGYLVHAQDGKFEFGVAGVTVQLVLAWAEGARETLDVLCGSAVRHNRPS
jgi:hypothetical protein